jgi:uncharacterized protein with ParB-like and HNH nuclease domain
MSPKLEHEIKATSKTIRELLNDKKFYIDDFQREYRWKEKHIKQMIDDLTTTFLKFYKQDHSRLEVINYQNYYLGPVVFSESPDNGKKSIIDGQQRITSITLLLIYLNHRQKNNQNKVNINELIFSEKFGEKSFNICDKQREDCLKSLFEDGEYTLKDNDDETVQNMVERYEDIEQSFPEEINETALPYFIDWLLEKVVVVEIIAYSDENAYTIFETMNDRGLNLSPTEMLKGFVLSKITDKEQREEINKLWKKQIQMLHQIEETTDLSFFQAWFRSKYAKDIRGGGTEDQDFDFIGSRFHNWFKENYKTIFKLEKSDSFYNFFKSQFPFYVKWYLECLKAQREYNKEMPHLHYIYYWGIAESLQMPLLLSPINFNDDEKTIKQKLDAVARYIETFTVRRAINFKRFAQSSIKYTMFNIVKEIRNKDIKELFNILNKKVEEIPEKWDGVKEFYMHGKNKKFVKHLLSRISSYIDNLCGKNTTYVTYHHPDGKQFEIEHIWADKFDEHKDEFEQEHDFQKWRNFIGALLLLPNGTNQSFTSDNYENKLDYYIRENTYAQSLHPEFYTKNPNFLRSEKLQQLSFKSHEQFKKKDIEERQELVQRICEQLWSVDYFRLND